MYATIATYRYDPGISDPDNCYSSRVIQAQDLLRKSQDISGTGLHVLDLIERGSLKPDRILYTQLLKRCTQAQKLREGRIVHSHVLNSQFGGDVVIRNTIVNMYVRCGSLAAARKVFDEIPVKDVVTWTTLITGYAQDYQSESALRLFPQMLCQGLEPNEFTLSSLIKASGASLSGENNGRQIHSQCLKRGYDSDLHVGTSLVDMYARLGGMDEARLIFDGLVIKNEATWNSLIAAHARKAEVGPALELFWMMRRDGFQSSPFTYSSMCTAFASTGALEHGKWVHAQVIKFGSRLVTFVGNTLLEMYTKAGSVDDAKKVFDRLKSRDVVSWNSLLAGYARHGLGKEAVIKFKEMSRIGIRPNDATFLYLLTACSNAGLVDQGQRYFELMKNKYKIEPQVSHLVMMVHLLGRAGLVGRAEKFIRESPIKSTEMLRACKIYTSGSRVLKRKKEPESVVKKEPESVVKREPVCAWVEIENSLHVFIASKGLHPWPIEIYEISEKIRRKIDENGGVPDSMLYHLYMDKQMKETDMQLHCEKLALAFALLNTAPGSSIPVVRNLVGN